MGSGLKGLMFAPPVLPVGTPTQSSLRDGSDDAHDLPDHFSRDAVAQRPEEHLRVHADMLDGRGLSEHVSALQVPEPSGGVASALCRSGGIQFLVDSWFDALGERHWGSGGQAV